MAIKKSDLVGILTPEEQREIANLETRIDTSLRDAYRGGTISIYLPRYPGARVQGEVKKRYNDAGWAVAFFAEDMLNSPHIALW